MKHTKRGFSLVEIMVFFLVAVIVLLIVLDLFTGSGRIIKRAQRTAAGQSELQTFTETLATDIEELAYFKEAAPLDVKDGGAGKWELVILSNREETGLTKPSAPELRQVTYEFSASKTKGASKVTRQVAQLKPGGKLDDKLTTGGTSQVGDSIFACKIVPFIWTPVPGTGWRLTSASDASANEEGSGAACVSLSIKVSEPAGDKEKEGGDISLTTRLWSRARLLALAREGRPQ